MTPKDFALKAYQKWGEPLDEKSECIVNEMQADMMVLVGIIYALSTNENTIGIAKDKQIHEVKLQG